MYIYDYGIIQQRPRYSELLNCSQEKRWCGRHSAIYHPWTFHGELSYFYAYYIYILYTHVIYTYYLTSVNASPDGWYILSRVRSSWTSEYKLNHTLSMSFKYLHIHAMYMNDIDFLFVWKGKIHMVSRLDALFVWIWFCSIAEKIHSVTKMEWWFILCSGQRRLLFSLPPFVVDANIPSGSCW